MQRATILTSAVTAVALFGMVGTASAVVTFDPSNGKGFAGKGDVQNVYGWNNQQMQANVGGVGFKYVASDTYEYECEWFTGPERNRKRHTVTHQEISAVNGKVAYDKKVTGQFTGWNLIGWLDAPTVIGDVPAVGDACPGNEGTGAVVYEVSEDPISSLSELFATYSGSDKLIWTPPPVLAPVQ